MAMAFSLEPQVLIADEPTTGLDPCTQAEILTNLQNLVSRTKVSLLLITHDLRAAGTLCRQAIVLDRGAVVAEGTWDELEANRAASDAILDAVRRVGN
jgi:peptide/nickel transport system ATP-binding protein